MDPFTHFKSNIAFKIFVVIIKMSLNPNWSSVLTMDVKVTESHI
jgi:hypothetical protein